MQKLGQHFLKNQQVIKTIITAIDARSGETIIEIGSGHGALTIPLAATCEKNGAHMISIEKDGGLFGQLQTMLAENPKIKNLALAQGDALELLPKLISGLADEQRAHYKLVGNIPYYITGHLLRIVGELEDKPTRCIFMIQKEVAERACAEPPKMNRLAASLQFWSVPQIVARVPKADFSPPPKIDSAVIRLETKMPTSAAEPYYTAMRILFAQPRKTVLNNLADGKNHPKEKIESWLKSIPIDPGLRPQNLTIEDIVRIAEILH